MQLFYYLPYLNIFEDDETHNTVNLRDRDNLRRKDNTPVPKVSFVLGFDCTSISSTCSYTCICVQDLIFMGKGVGFEDIYINQVVLTRGHQSQFWRRKGQKSISRTV